MTYLCPIDGTSKKQAEKQNNCFSSHISKTKWKQDFLEFVTICTMYIKHDRILTFFKKSFSEVFGRTKLHKKGSTNIYSFLLKKVIAISRSILKYCLRAIFD